MENRFGYQITGSIWNIREILKLNLVALLHKIWLRELKVSSFHRSVCTCFSVKGRY